jgi:hypothetical protein
MIPISKYLNVCGSALIYHGMHTYASSVQMEKKTYVYTDHIKFQANPALDGSNSGIPGAVMLNCAYTVNYATDCSKK